MHHLMTSGDDDEDYYCVQAKRVHPYEINLATAWTAPQLN